MERICYLAGFLQPHRNTVRRTKSANLVCRISLAMGKPFHTQRQGLPDASRWIYKGITTPESAGLNMSRRSEKSTCVRNMRRQQKRRRLNASRAASSETPSATRSR
ncbi:hypothetical protein TRVL_04576 [Trypanosoma vivax]|uniref:Uncharacterized protein n=1 Tax=Trypanosoma vivax (strain Y486) TaxID=1055687 RepID=G0UAS0_TRYVY|nr:hypothetical protein TRVL_04576 [Trypanosoma vivax]CCC52906.1 hypothetical protein, unlikely [Trypanosoma vivax Y486]